MASATSVLRPNKTAVCKDSTKGRGGQLGCGCGCDDVQAARTSIRKFVDGVLPVQDLYFEPHCQGHHGRSRQGGTPCPRRGLLLPLSRRVGGPRRGEGQSGASGAACGDAAWWRQAGAFSQRQPTTRDSSATAGTRPTAASRRMAAACSSDARLALLAATYRNAGQLHLYSSRDGKQSMLPARQRQLAACRLPVPTTSAVALLCCCRHNDALRSER